MTKAERKLRGRLMLRAQAAGRAAGRDATARVQGLATGFKRLSQVEEAIRARAAAEAAASASTSSRAAHRAESLAARASARRLGRVVSALAGTAALGAVFGYAADQIGQSSFGEGDYSPMWYYRQSLLNGLGMESPAGYNNPWPQGYGAMAMMAGVAAGGLAAGRWAFRPLMTSGAAVELMPTPKLPDAPEGTSRLGRGLHFAREALRNPAHVSSRVGNWAASKTQALGYAGALMTAVATASIVGGAIHRTAQGVMALAPRMPTSYQPTATRRRSSATGSRLARRAGDPSGIGATGDLVFALHRNNGRGMVLQ